MLQAVNFQAEVENQPEFGDEYEMVQAVLAGDMDAFNCLVEQYQDPIYWWVFSIVKDEALADDITQATLITAYEKLSNFRAGSLKAWLFTIARNRSLDEIRRRKRRPALSLDDSAEDDRDLLSVLPANAPQPEDVLVAAEEEVQVELALRLLPQDFQQVLRLIDMEGMEYQEVATILRVPLGTLKSRVSRARRKLQEKLVRSGLIP